MVATKTSVLVAVDSTSVSTFWRKLFEKVLLRYTPDHTRLWKTYWSASKPFWRLCTWRFTYSKGNIDWCRRIYHFFSLLRGSVREKTSQIPLLIICWRHWYLYDLMDISGFPSLGMPLDLTEPAYVEHVLYILLLFFTVCEWNWPLCIVTLHLLNSSLYWPPGNTQSYFSLDQVEQFILEPGSVPDQGAKESSFPLYNPPHRGEYILSPDPSIFSENLITTMVDVYPSRDVLLIIAPSGAKASIRIDSCFYSSEKKPWTHQILLRDNHSSKS